MNNFRFKRGLFTAINGQFKDQIHNYISSSSDSFVSHWFGSFVIEETLISSLRGRSATLDSTNILPVWKRKELKQVNNYRGSHSWLFGNIGSIPQMSSGSDRFDLVPTVYIPVK